MIRPAYREALASQHKILVVLWLVFLAGIFLYLWISQRFLMERPSAVENFIAQAAAIFLWLLAFADLATLVWWKRRFLTREAILGGVKQYKVLQSLQEHETPLEELAAAVVSSYVTGKIVAFALAEAVAIYGFALALVSRDFSSQFILSAAAAALLLFEFPSKTFLAGLLKDVESGAVSPPIKATTAP
ncbi:MAG: hypothetical protein ACREQP_04700 [Candidatus Binatia bacterium]